MSERKATAKWNGTLKEGNGVMSFANYNGPFTFKSRFEEGDGTNPEELVGAAQAGCFSMFLAALISGENLSPEKVETTAKVTLGSDDVGPVITSIELNSVVVCEGLSQVKFDELAQTAKTNCPISRLYKGTEVILNATLK